MKDSTYDKAKLLIQEVDKALADGIRYYNKNGELLTSTKQIVETLVTEGSVTLNSR